MAAVMLMSATSAFAAVNSGYAEYKQSLLSKGFPESYLPMLMELHDQHPTWEYTPLMVTEINDSGYTWDYVIEQMLAVPARNLMVKATWAPAPFTQLGDGNYAPYRDESKGTFDTGVWYAITPEATEYFIDPRNFLNEYEIFMFLDWDYSGDSIKTEHIEKVFGTSVFANKIIPDYDGTTTYAKFLVDTATELNVNPLFVASRLVQENGNGSPMIDGTTGDELNNPEYNGLYNFFNIEAGGSGHEQIYTNGMKEAVKGTPSKTEEWGGSPSWDKRWKAMYGGILKLRDDYVGKYKNTLYLQKFNTDPRATLNFSGYMQNVIAPITEGRSTQKAIVDFGLLETGFEFLIPVYSDMPDLPCPDPGNGITRCSPTVPPVTKYVAPYVTAYDANGGYTPQNKKAIEVTYNIDHKSTAPIEITGWSLSMDGVAQHYYTVDGSEAKNALTAVTRTDVTASYSDYAQYCSAEKAGYTGTFTPDSLSAGTHTIDVYGVTDGGDSYKTAVLTLNVKATSGYYSYLDGFTEDSVHNEPIEATVDLDQEGSLPLRGWSVNTAGTKSFYYTIDNGEKQYTLPAERRYDILTNGIYNTFANYCDSTNIGFNGVVDLSELTDGAHTITVYAKNNSGASYEVAVLTVGYTAPTYISSAEALRALADETDTEGKVYVLTRSLDLGGETLSKYIGTAENPFKGTFDGGGFVISNFKINPVNGSNGLFGEASGNAVIKNLGVKNVEAVEAVDIWNIVVGGIVGKLTGTATVTDCYVKDIYMEGIVDSVGERFESGGGIVGWMAGNGAQLKNSYCLGYLAKDVNYDAGLVGRMTTAEDKIINCYTDTLVTVYNAPSEPNNIINTYYAAVNDIPWPWNNGWVGNGGEGIYLGYVGTQKTTDELKAIAQDLDTSFVSDADNKNSGYPVLVWETREIILPDFEIENVEKSLSASGQNVKGSAVVIVNNNTSKKDATVSLAFYYDNKLVALQSAEVTLNVGTNRVTFNDLMLTGMAGKDYTTKAFVWDNNLAPLCE